MVGVFYEEGGGSTTSYFSVNRESDFSVYYCVRVLSSTYARLVRICSFEYFLARLIAIRSGCRSGPVDTSNFLLYIVYIFFLFDCVYMYQTYWEPVVFD